MKQSLVASLCVLALASSACGDDSSPSEADDSSAVSSDDAAASVEPTAEATTDATTETSTVAPADNSAEYFELLATFDIGDAASAAELAPPGSQAAAYATFWSAYEQAALDSGWDLSEYVEPLQTTPTGFTLCPPVGGKCEEVSDIQVTEDGKIATFTVSGHELGDVLTIGNGKSQPLGDGQVKMLAAYHSPAGDVVVVFEVKSGKTALSLSYVQDYRSPGGRKMEDTDSLRPSDLPPNSLANVSFTFAKTEFGGDVTYRAYPADFNDPTELTATFQVR